MWDQPNRSTDACALFAQGTYSYSPKWHVTLGYRYSDETKEDKGGNTYLYNSGYACDIEGGNCPRSDYNALPADYFENPYVYPETSANDNKGSWDHHDFRVGLDYQKSENTLLYSYLATGFKAGGIGDVFMETNPRTGEEINVRTSFEPEEVTTLELGFKTRLLDRKLDLRGAYFYSDYENMQYASVGAIAYTERWQALRDESGEYVRDEWGNIVFGWVARAGRRLLHPERPRGPDPGLRVRVRLASLDRRPDQRLCDLAGHEDLGRLGHQVELRPRLLLRSRLRVRAGRGEPGAAGQPQGQRAGRFADRSSSTSPWITPSCTRSPTRRSFPGSRTTGRTTPT